MIQEIIFMHEYHSKVMYEFSKHFTKNKTLSVDLFMDLQLKVFNKLKKKYNIKGD